MLACSESLGQLAGALARAQLQVTNPQKTLTATLERSGSGGRGRTYRYAPLSSGLEIIRKALGEQEIAVLQTTSVAQGREVLELTTTLVHGSGEWVATTWPVCRLGDISDPKLMGAALTYARRYSLFALVGITGEDDLDAPELGGDAGRGRAAGAEDGQPVSRPLTHTQRSRRASGSKPLSHVRGRVHGPIQAQAPSPALGVHAENSSRPVSTSDVLVGLEAVQDEAGLLQWVRDAMPRRATLEASDRASLDQAFLRRAEAFGWGRDVLSTLSPPDEPGVEALPFTPILGGSDAQAPV